MKPNTFTLFCGLVLAALTPTLHADTKTWNGSVNAIWETAGNWLKSGMPMNTDDAVLTGTSAGGFSLRLGPDTAVRSVNSLTFDGTAMTPYIINLDNAGVAGTKLLVKAGGVKVLAGSHTIQGAGAGTTGKGGFEEGGITFNIATGATLTLNTKLNHGDTIKLNREKVGAGTLVLGANSGGTGAWNFSEAAMGFVIREGTLKLASSGATGHSGNKFAVASGATLELAEASPYGSRNTTLTLNGAGVNGIGALHASVTSKLEATINGAGSVTLAGDTTMGVAAGQTLIMNQFITGIGGLTKAGAGTLTLAAVNTYEGKTVVSSGTLMANTGSATGAGTVSVTDASAVLGGSGGVGALTVTAGTLSPGSQGTADTGTLTTGNLTLGPAAVCEFGINGAAAGTFDQLRVRGTVTLGGTLNFALMDPSPLISGDLLCLVINDGEDAVNGKFTGLAEGAVFTIGRQQLRITYRGNYDEELRRGSFTGGNDVMLMAPNTVPPAPQFTIQSIRRDAVMGNITLTWDSVPGDSYIIRYSTDLQAFPGNLGVAVPAAAAPAASTRYTFASPVPDASRLFFRVERR
ncbi:MAG: autotransporter-associated beta strand repeat-containing protein [Verrucomicrobiota bacterium]